MSSSDNKKLLPPCTHKAYVWNIKLTSVNNELIALNQPILKIKLLCKECFSPCLFKANKEFSVEKPSISIDRSSLIVPFNYPLIFTQNFDKDKDNDNAQLEDSEENKKPITIH